MRLTAFFIVLTMVLSSASFAQQKVSVRPGVHPDYSRIVFDWPGAPPYALTRNGGTLIMAFEGAADIDLSSLNARDVPNVSAAKLLSAQGENVRLSLDVPAASRVRDFKIGSRVIVDVYTPDGKPNTQALAAKKKAKKVIAPVAEQPEQEEKADTEIAMPSPKEEEAEPVQEEIAADAQELEDSAEEDVVESAELPPQSLESHVITVTSTKNIGMAVFTRGPYLWLAIDDPEVAVAPQIQGPQKEFFDTPLSMVIQGGTVFRYPLPQGANVYAEGSGLLWRIVVTPNVREQKGFKPRRDIDPASRYRGGTMKSDAF